MNFTSAIPVAQIRKPPHVAQSDAKSYDGKDKFKLAVPLLPFHTFPFHFPHLKRLINHKLSAVYYADFLLCR